MKKRILLILLASLLCIFTACKKDDSKENDSESSSESQTNQVESSSEGESSPESETAEFVPLDVEPYDYMSNDLTPFIKLGNYTGLKVERGSYTLTNEDFENELDTLLESYSHYAEITDRAVEAGDTINADYSGYLGEKQFEGGTAVGVELTASADAGYIPGFAEAFIGKKPGEDFSFDITFPEDYHNTEMAGKAVVFKCKVNCIYGTELITYELTDEFAKEKLGFNNAEEFKISFRTTVEKRKKIDVDNEVYSELWMQILDSSEVIAYPGQEVDRIYGLNRTMYEEYAKSYGLDYLTFISAAQGMTDQDVYDQCKAYVKEDLVMYQIVKEFDLKISDDDFKNELKNLAEYYGATEDEMLAYYGEETLRATITWQKAMEKITELSVITEAE